MAARNMLRLAAVEAKTGLKKSAIYAEMAKDAFPRPVNISAQAVAWFEDEIEDWQKKLDRARGGWCPRDRKHERQPASDAA
jgi:prophage regulatory protein